MSLIYDNLITPEGFDSLKKKLEEINKQLSVVAKKIDDARSEGDLKENGAYHASREEQRNLQFMKDRILKRCDRLQVMDYTNFFPGNKNLDFVCFDCVVDLARDNGKIITSYHIVGEDESNLDQGLLSITSPLGQSLLGKKIGDIVEYEAPTKIMCYTIKDIKKPTK